MDSNAIIEMIEKLNGEIEGHRIGRDSCLISCWCHDLDDAKDKLQNALESERWMNTTWNCTRCENREIGSAFTECPNCGCYRYAKAETKKKGG